MTFQTNNIPIMREAISKDLLHSVNEKTTTPCLLNVLRHVYSLVFTCGWRRLHLSDNVKIKMYIDIYVYI